ncbi:MAG TPA: hypothetical protein PLD27_01720 [bacterium]|nr:hypothetical protein [bacterium]HOL47669.1 hypothetical protein [bacterium]HPQ18426.1 hypothetical protein [bacterium]
MNFQFDKIINLEITIIIFFLFIFLLQFFIKRIIKKKIFSFQSILLFIICIILYLLFLNFRIIISYDKYYSSKVPFIIDTSESMLFKKQLKLEHPQIIKYYFGNSLLSQKKIFSGTDILMLNKIFNYEEPQYFENILFYSDGNFTVNAINEVRNKFIEYNKKIIILIDEDNNRIRDFGINEIQTNDYFIADTENFINLKFQGNFYPANIKLDLFENNILIKSVNLSQEQLKRLNNNYLFNFVPLITAKNHYKIHIADLSDSNQYNNSYEFINEVISEQKNIYIIMNYPYYDYKFFKYALANIKNYSIVECQKFNNEKLNKNNLKNSELIILYNLKINNFLDEEISILKNELKQKPFILFINNIFDYELIKKLELNQNFKEINNIFSTGEIKTKLNFDNSKKLNDIVPYLNENISLPPVETYLKIKLSDDFLNLINVENTDFSLIAINPINNICIISGAGFYKWQLNLIPLNAHFFIQEFYKNITKFLIENKKQQLSEFLIFLPKDNFFIDDFISFKIIKNSNEINNVLIELYKENNLIKSEKIKLVEKEQFINYELNEYGLYKILIKSQNQQLEKIFCIIKNLKELNQNNVNYGVLETLANSTNGKIININSEKVNELISANKIKTNVKRIINFKDNIFVIIIILTLLSIIWIIDKYFLENK